MDDELVTVALVDGAGVLLLEFDVEPEPDDCTAPSWGADMMVVCYQSQGRARTEKVGLGSRRVAV